MVSLWKQAPKQFPMYFFILSYCFSSHYSYFCHRQPWDDLCGSRSLFAYYLTLPLQVDEFCDDYRNPKVRKELKHDPFAPHKQNIVCGGRSAWEVMREHMDFKSKSCSRNFMNEWESEIIQLMRAVISARYWAIVMIIIALTSMTFIELKF